MNEAPILEHQKIWLEEVTNTNTKGDVDGNDGWSEPVDMSRWIPYLTVDTVSEIGFSRNFGLTRDGRFRQLPQIFTALVGTNFKVGHMPPILQSLLNALLESPIMSLMIPPEVRKFDEFTDQLIAERVEHELNQKPGSNEPELRDDFVHLFRDHEGNLNQASVEEIKAEATLLLVAGSDTFATALSSVLFYLTHNSHCLERATAEIRSCFPTVDDVKRGPELSRARYLRACIDESLRLSPSVPGYLPREVLPGGGGDHDRRARLPCRNGGGRAHLRAARQPSILPSPVRILARTMARRVIGVSTRRRAGSSRLRGLEHGQPLVCGQGAGVHGDDAAISPDPVSVRHQAGRRRDEEDNRRGARTERALGEKR
ncbi:hypothetical protein VTN77DRAFT_2588 [Rasamsonia byssochlamydoides]|uniref:uncharacterized protein n=1 Tax=Rasamsonia byssochlamydoides TaxID=89139 RepID=UPI0037437318